MALRFDKSEIYTVFNYREGESTKGPFLLKEILGRLTPETWVHTVKDGWFQAKDHPETKIYFQGQGTTTSEAQVMIKRGGDEDGPYTVNEFLSIGTAETLIASTGGPWIEAKNHPLTSTFFNNPKPTKPNEPPKPPKKPPVLLLIIGIVGILAVSGAVIWWIKPDWWFKKPEVIVETERGGKVPDEIVSYSLTTCSGNSANVALSAGPKMEIRALEVSSMVYSSSAEAENGSFTNFIDTKIYRKILEGSWWIAVRYQGEPSSAKAISIDVICGSQKSVEESIKDGQLSKKPIPRPNSFQEYLNELSKAEYDFDIKTQLKNDCIKKFFESKSSTVYEVGLNNNIVNDLTIDEFLDGFMFEFQQVKVVSEETNDSGLIKILKVRLEN